MKILHIITRSEIGGAQVVVRELVRHMPKDFSAIVAAGESGFLQDECKVLGVPFQLVPGLVRNVNPFADIVALLRIISLIRRARVDVVHCHTSKAGIIARFACWLTRTPSVFTAHTWSFDQSMSAMKRFLSVHMERVAASLGGPIITVSEANRRKALQNRIAPPEKIIRIWLGIPDIHLQADPGSHDTVTLIMTARFAVQKDHATLLKALARVKGNWRLLLVGEGPLLEQARDLSSDLRLQTRVSFLGSRADVPELLARSDVFVLSTKWEGLPVSILEAMRAGLPVIASDVGGISEMVQDGVSGFLTRVGDEKHLAEAIQRLVDSPALRCSLGAEGRNRYCGDFQIDKCTRDHARLYRLCILKGPSKSTLAAKNAG